MAKAVRFAALFTACLCLVAYAQEKPAAPKAKKPSGAGEMPKPRPPEEMRDLRALVGIWTTEEKFEPSQFMPSGGTGKGTNTARPGPGGFTILLEQRSRSAMGPFSGHGVMTWDPNEKAYKFIWADSMSPGVMIETGHKEGDDLVFTGETAMQGKKISVRDVISDRTPASYTLTSYMDDGSGEKKMMTIRFTKAQPGEKK